MKKELSVLIKPASSLCNLRCNYCFYADVSQHREVQNFGIMSRETADIVLDRLMDVLEEQGVLHIAFQGGEPTMAGLSFFSDFTIMAEKKARNKKITVSFSLQTNGILLDDQWCCLLKNHRFLVGLSLDGPESFHNANRINAFGEGTWNKVIQAENLLQRYRIPFNLLCVLTDSMAAHPEQIWKYIIENGCKFIQFIPCIPGLGTEHNRYSLTPERFHSFFLQLFQLWKKHVYEGDYISIKLFDDMANLLIHHRISSCGICGKCVLQYIVEADGSVYPCDFYVLDQYRLGNLIQDPVDVIEEHYRHSSFHELRSEFPEMCSVCKYRLLCSGGCVRLRESIYLSDQYCGYAHLLKDIGDDLIHTAYYIERHF